MKQKLSIIIILILLIALLAGLNAASYVQKEKTPDSEISPNRSTFNAGATGTQAYYTLLAETGHRTVRWQDAPAALLTAGDNAPAVFVVTGALRRPLKDIETDELLEWVASGGRLVIIDREPSEKLLTTTANWKITFDGVDDPQIFTSDPADTGQMTAGTPAVRPVQPTLVTQNVNAVQPSKFAASVMIEPLGDGDTNSMPSGDVSSPNQAAPVVHFTGGDRNLVVDAPFGNGRIVFLSDPFIVSNGGIALVDNAQLAVNLVAAGDSVIAFDEYHQGYGVDNNRFLQFFLGTPVIAIFLQAVAFVGLLFFSQSRRFARPVPEPEPDRLSKLEYVAAMAELQNRTKAYDLAIENIYNEFRRRVTRYLGLDNSTAKGSDIARLVAERSGFNENQIGDAIFQCEEIIRGAPTNKREVLRLAGLLRDVETNLGLTRTGRTRV